MNHKLPLINIVRRAAGVLALAVGACAAPGGIRNIYNSSIFNVREFGASGIAADDARPPIQRAIDACAAAGGGTVYFPPGEYTSGTLELKSRVQIHIDAGATVYSAKGKDSFPKEALFFGEDLVNISIRGGGKVDGRAEYEWRENDIDDSYIYPNLLMMQKAGKSLRRAFPKKDSVGHLLRLVRCADVQIRDLSFVRSPSWTMHLWGCERIIIDGVYIQTSLTDGVWADGIDPDGCRDLRVSNCTIETGDDALVFYSTNLFGPARPCEDITVTNCRFTSSSSAIKFCDGNQNCVRRVNISNCAITNSNRGVAFMVFDGGYVSDVVISNLTIDCARRDWFWWGDGDPLHFNIKRRDEIDPRLPADKQPPAGSIRNVILRDIVARGTGASTIEGNIHNPLRDITIENVALRVAADPRAPYDRTEHAIIVKNAENITLRNVSVSWEGPPLPRWQSALYCDNVKTLQLEGFAASQAPVEGAFMAILLQNVRGAVLRNCRAAAGTLGFLHLIGEENSNVQMIANDLREAAIPVSAQHGELLPTILSSSGDLLPAAPSDER